MNGAEEQPRVLCRTCGSPSTGSVFCTVCGAPSGVSAGPVAVRRPSAAAMVGVGIATVVVLVGAVVLVPRLSESMSSPAPTTTAAAQARSTDDSDTAVPRKTIVVTVAESAGGDARGPTPEEAVTPTPAASEPVSAAGPAPVVAPAPAPPPAAAPTELILVNPTLDGRIRSEFAIEIGDPVTGCSTSSVSQDPGVYRCGSTADSLAACWPVSTGMACQVSPFDDTVRLVQVEGDFYEQPVSDPSPWVLDLADGSRCYVRLGGAWGLRADDYNPVYQCDGPSPFVLQHLDDGTAAVDTSGDRWTVLVGEVSGTDVSLPPPATVEVDRAWFAVGDR